MFRTLLSSALLTALAACVSANHQGEIHSDHSHVHGEGCGHTMVWHDDHWDYLHDGHLHHVHGDHVDEQVLSVSLENPDAEVPLDPALHADHTHGEANDAHMMIRHGDHVDYIHDGRLHNVHDGHVDDHGPVKTKANG